MGIEKTRYVTPHIVELGNISSITRSTLMGPYCDSAQGRLSPFNTPSQFCGMDPPF